MTTTHDVNIKLRDGGLGAVSLAARPMVLIATATGGPSTPQQITSPKQAADIFTSGPLVEYAAAYLKTVGASVILQKAATVTPASNSAVTSKNATGSGAATGTSVVTLDTDLPTDDGKLVLYIVKGGTRGTSGIIVQASRDGGRTWALPQALGTAVSYVQPVVGVEWLFAAGTLITGEYYTATATGPQTNAASIADAIAAVKTAKKPFDGIGILAPISASDATTIDLALVDMRNAYQYAWAVAGTVDESNPANLTTWKNGLTSTFSAFASTEGRLSVAPGGYLMTSALDGSKLRRTLAYFAAARAGAIPISEELGRFASGAVIGMDFGAPLALTPNLPGSHEDAELYYDAGDDDELALARFLTARRYEGESGAYFFDSSTMAKAGSDYSLVPYVRVVAEACRVTRKGLLFYMNSAIRVDVATGKILEADAQGVEKRIKKMLEDALQAPGHITPGGITVVVDRNANILSTKVLPVDESIVPVGYAGSIPTTLGLVNPALQVV